MKKYLSIIILCVMLAACCVSVQAAESDSWREAYASTAKAHGNKYGQGYILADLDIDGIPELILGTYPGSGLFSCGEKVFTYRGGQVVQLPKTEVIISDEYELYQQYGTNELRVEGDYVVRSGWAYNVVISGTYALDNGLQFKEAFGKATETADKTYKESYTYYVGGMEVPESAYNGAKDAYHIGWMKFESYKPVSFWKHNKPSDAEFSEWIASYQDGPALAVPSEHKVELNGVPVSPAGYTIAENNYYKLRDIAALLKDTGVKFNIAWNEAEQTIDITTGKNYEFVGGELSGAATYEYNLVAEPGDAVVRINGTAADLKAYNIYGNNYYKLRDLGAKLGFGVGWNEKTETVMITTNPLYPMKGVEIAPTDVSASLSNGVKCDYPAAVGTPLYAPGKGTVEYRQSFADVDGDGKPELVSYGNQVFFTAEDGSYTVLMAHLSDFNIPEDKKKDMIPSTQSRELGASEVPGRVNTVRKYSKEVEAGELLGLSGKTGHAHGPHVHMEVKKAGAYQDPKNFFETW